MLRCSPRASSRCRRRRQQNGSPRTSRACTTPRLPARSIETGSKRSASSAADNSAACLTLDAKRMGYRRHHARAAEHSPCGQVADEQIVAAYDDLARDRRARRRSDVVTYEFENIRLDSVRHLEALGHRVWPASGVLRITQDRFSKRSSCAKRGIATTAFARVRTPAISRSRCGGSVSRGHQDGARRLRRQRPVGRAIRLGEARAAFEAAEGAALIYERLADSRAS